MNNRKNVTMFAFLIAACLSMQACSTTMLNGDEFVLRGTPEGLRAFSESQEGLVILGKTSPESLPSNPQSALRMAQEESRRLRITVKRKGE